MTDELSHQRNCAHSTDGWCLVCVRKYNDRMVAASARKEAKISPPTDKRLSGPLLFGSVARQDYDGPELRPDGVQTLRGLNLRVETGPLQFDRDWPGIFIRGDRAAHYVMALSAAAGRTDDPAIRATLQELQKLMGSALVEPGGAVIHDGVLAGHESALQRDHASATT